LKFVVPAIAALGATLALASPPQEFCDAMGAAARRLATDRNNGISYKEQTKRIRAAVATTSDPASTEKLFDGLARTVYIEMPRLTPEGAYSFARVACMTSP
jgi:hypothetical protein